MRKTITIEHILTKDQIVDTFTKLLHGDQFRKLSSLLMSSTKIIERIPHVMWFVYEQDLQSITRDWKIYDGPYDLRQLITNKNETILIQC